MKAVVAWFTDGEYHRWAAHGQTEEQLQEEIELIVLIRSAENYWVEREGAGLPSHLAAVGAASIPATPRASGNQGQEQNDERL